MNTYSQIRISQWTTWIIITALMAGLANAATIEDFNYPDGTAIATQSGGTDWAAAWGSQAGNGTIVASAGSLTYPGLTTSGNKMQFTGIAGTGTSTNTFRTLATPLTEGNTYYIRILAQNLNDGLRFFGLALFNPTAEQMLLGQSSTSPNWTINHVTGFASNTLVSDVDSSTMSLLVLKLELLSGAERVTFWVNPDLSQPENVATAQGGSSHMTDADFGSITRVRIGGGGFSAGAGGDPTNHYLDEIVMGVESPFPSPFTVWIGGFGIPDPLQRAPDADPDLDGIVNAQEFYLNTSPVVTTASLKASIVGGNLRLEFQRRDDAEDLSVVLEYGVSLLPAGWTAAQHGVNGVTINVTENGDAPDAVEALIPVGVDQRLFARFNLTLN